MTTRNYAYFAFVTAALALAQPAAAAERWTLISQSYGGTVSINQGLTKPECDRAHDILLRKADLALVHEEYKRLEAKEWKEYYDKLAWQKDHPQCKHVMWSGYLGNSQPAKAMNYTPDKDGWCDFPSGTEPNAIGSGDASNHDPSKNTLILQYALRQAYANVGLPAPDEDGKPGDIKTAVCFVGK